jgi:putative hydrolase of the HAD superfamily
MRTTDPEDRPVRAVTFDFGQTLADLDTAMLARRIGERGFEVSGDRLESEVAGAWRAYNEAILAGLGGHPWRLLMDTLLAGAGLPESARPALCEWLWSEQPARNLWRRPIPGMVELLDELALARIPIAVISNSEGKLHELAAELGWADRFVAIADSGRLGLEKPGRAIFTWTADRLGVPPGAIVHIGDSYAADVEGALGAGMRAIWFRGDRARTLPDGAAVCDNAAEVRAALHGWGLRAPDPQ